MRDGQGITERIKNLYGKRKEGLAVIEQIDYVSAVFVSDLDRAVDFYEALGFVTQESGNKPGVSWVEVALADDSYSMALITFEDASAFRDRIGGYTGVTFLTDDIQQSYQQLREMGVRFQWKPVSRPWGDSDALFLDQDDNKLLLVDRGSPLTILGRHHRPVECSEGT